MVRHKCRVKNCFYAPHLEWGTQKENSGIDKERDGTLPRGEANSMVKLSSVAVEMIRCLLAGGFSQYDIAELFDVSQSNVSMIHSGKTWAS
jgi:predicted XRE-type DNA-binding protein